MGMYRTIITLGTGATLVTVAACATLIGLDEPASDSCHRYCDLVAEQCDGANLAQFLGHSPESKLAEDGTSLTPYEQQTQCLAYCAALESSQGAQEPQGNTIACRTAVLESTEQSADPARKCEDAGPGSRVCSDIPGDPDDPAVARSRVCANYCELHELQCGSSPQEPCDCVDDDGDPIDIGNGRYTIGATGDTLFCRIYHITVSMVETPAAHCSHAGIISAMDVCVDAGGGTGGGGGMGGMGTGGMGGMGTGGGGGMGGMGTGGGGGMGGMGTGGMGGMGTGGMGTGGMGAGGGGLGLGGSLGVGGGG